MDDDERRTRGVSFGSVVEAYAAARPDYPDDAVRWLVGDEPATVLELGAGTGKLTANLCALGHRVIATDPDAEMLARLASTAPAAHILQARAEDIPLPSSSVQVVIAGQAYHWFDLERALPEIARVLRPGGTLAVVWNRGDHRVPWVKKFLSLSGTPLDDETDDPFDGSSVFVLTDTQAVKHWQPYRRDTLTGFVASTSKLATATPADRERLLAEAGALYDSYERGPDGLLMPWIAMCYRGRVAGLDAPDEIADNADAAAMTAGNDDTVVISFS